ncbi:hypothetical protein N781_08985 [Pontibacillus halophilus JSM 076056 = DSM 19796]|uniref:ABC3 transporter permease C-terminal domain-containing protein n=1 Tax=Pontibacillus halophilus JSM 076056 = DSM 19796 TaxID=1385510 RepID=A0A0A5I1V9_9BACI|nr:ABC transporter permease [Pontibacillus halophilus]KGX89842.1 hypothetical protein N781_08985 [Pontibacillus halophilus JSM 076056 = DSM 19796]
MHKLDLLTLGWKNFIRHGFKTIGPIVIISIGLIVFNLVAGFFMGVENSMNETVIENDQLKFIEVSSSNEEALQSEDGEVLQQIDGVSVAFPSETALVGVEKEKERTSTMVLGVPTEALSFFTGEDQVFSSEESVLLNDKYKDFKAGEEVELSYTVKVKEGEGVRSKLSAEIVGTYKQPDLLGFPDNLSLVPISLVNQINANFEQMTVDEYTAHHKPDRYIVIAENVEELVNVATTIEDKGYTTNYALQSSKQLPVVAKLLIGVGGALAVILLGFAAVSISSIMNQSLKNRYKEIGIMKAIGYKRKHITSLLSVEVLYIGLASFVLSILSSYVLMFFFNQYIESKDGLSILSLTFNGKLVLLSLFLVLLVSLGSSYRAITKAAKLDPVETLRSE